MKQTNVAAAVGLMIFGLVLVGARQAGAPVAAVSPQPGQRARDKGLSDWLGLVVVQGGTWNDAMPSGRQSIDSLVNYTAAQ